MSIIGMRFIENGPLIPGDLLEARDQGRVVFFCGAGVSLAYAKLPDFVELTKKVCESLKLRASNEAEKLLTLASKIEDEEKISGVVSMDRVFGLLEREFGAECIERKVAENLRPSKKVDRCAHKILRDLSTTKGGRIQLVTTNFDRLFTDVSPDTPSFVGPRLPDLNEALHGIVYLHGQANKKHNGAEKGGFVLSSSSFGRAYLTQGWATDFFKKLIAHYNVVFVGYTANDPPMSYLLEALNPGKTSLNGVYAFYSGDDGDGNAQWNHKGVTPICYDAKDRHSLLWDTLKAWSERANGLNAWRQSVIDKALKGPEALAPFERGQVAHLVSTLEGADKFAGNNPPPPAEWLCVFDPKCRYAEEQSHGRFFRWQENDLEVIKALAAYALDSDKQREATGRYQDTRDELINAAWSAFRLTNADGQQLNDDDILGFCAVPHFKYAKLPTRINSIGWWLARVCNQVTAVWWAAKQENLHPDIKCKIEWELGRIRCPDVINQAWQLLFDIWEKEMWDPGRFKQTLLCENIKIFGLTDITLRRFITVTRAYLQVKKHSIAMPPKKVEAIADIMDVEIVYPEYFSYNFDIPKSLLPLAIQGVRQNLEYVNKLIDEVNTYSETKIFDKKFLPSFSSNNDAKSQSLFSQVRFFMTLFERLIACDKNVAHLEFDRLPNDDDCVFAGLRVWVAGMVDFFKPNEAGDVFLSLSDTAFWHYPLQHDLCIALKARWNSLDKKTRKKLEIKITKGRKIWPGHIDNIKEKRAFYSLDRLEWLRKNGCVFTIDVESEMNRLKTLAPSWKAEYANPTRPLSSDTVRWVHFNKNYEPLLGIPHKDILKQAFAQKQATFDNTPFVGLAEERPLRALIALYSSSKYKNLHPEWAWCDFLTNQVRQNDDGTFIKLTARVLLSLPVQGVKQIFPSVCRWLEIVAEKLAIFAIDIFDMISSQVIDIAIQNDNSKNIKTLFAQYKGRIIDEAINTPIRSIYEALLRSPKLSHLPKNSKIPPEYKKILEKMLTPNSPTRRYSVCLLCRNMRWFYDADQTWTTKNLLPLLLERNNDDFIAAWDGFLSHIERTAPALFRQLSETMLELAKDTEGVLYLESLSWLVLWGWIFPDPKIKKPFISDSQLQNLLIDVSEDFRVAILRHMCVFLEKTQKDNQQSSSYRRLPKRFQKIWPQALRFQTENASQQLIFIPFSDSDRYSEWVDVIFPYLVEIPGGFAMEALPSYFGNVGDIIRKHPKKTLLLVHKILAPLNIKQWPYKAKETLASLLEADESLKHDPQFKELSNRLIQ